MSLKYKYIENTKSRLPKKIVKIRRKMSFLPPKLLNRIEGDFSNTEIDLSWDGKPMRYDLVNQTIKDLGYTRYLEIGCDVDQTFSKVSAPVKIGVDPFSGGTHRMTSDAFFAKNTEMFDCVFIDGLHLYEQVKLDIMNALVCLNPGGTIFLHDCLPLKHRYQTARREHGNWNGDVWKALVEARTNVNIDTAVCLIDQGVGIIKKRKNPSPLELNTTDFKTIRFEALAANYKQWLNTLEYADAARFIANK